ncbi:MAG: NmrA/HSCARG family protein, partial [Candidatus Krumholzibacteria bacterium]|nr:NmrA/HSCARG family protein [Candidatus Krumholzibacteria bacterium]
AGEHLTGAQMAAALSKTIGQEVRYNDVPPETYRSFGFPGADDMGNMFQFKRDFNDAFCGARKLETARSLNPSLQTFEAWLGKNGSQIPLE